MTKRITVSLTDAIHAKLESYALKTSRKISTVVELALAALLNKEAKK